MAAQTFRTDKLIKSLEELNEKRKEVLEDSEHMRNEYMQGQAMGIRRAMYNLMLEFNLTDTDLFLEIKEVKFPTKSEASES